MKLQSSAPSRRRRRTAALSSVLVSVALAGCNAANQWPATPRDEAPRRSTPGQVAPNVSKRLTGTADDAPATTPAPATTTAPAAPAVTVAIPVISLPPLTAPPLTLPPVTVPPVTLPPVTVPPVTVAPVTQPPTTKPPVTQPPATQPPTTKPPVTQPPATQPPATQPPVTSPPSSGFVAGTLNASNTGVPAGVSLTTQGGATFTAADNGKVISGVRFTGAVRIDGASNITIKNCVFAGRVSDGVYFQLTVRNSSNITIDHCTFSGSGGATAADVDGTTIYRSYITDFENAIRTHSNVNVIETLAEKPSLADPSAHIDGIEASGSPGEMTHDLLVRDSRIDIGTKYATAPLYLSPYTQLVRVTVERSWFIGGSNAAYVELDTRQVSIIDSRFDGYLYSAVMYRPATGSVLTSFSGNTANGSSLAKP